MFRHLVTPSSRNTIPQTPEDLADFIVQSHEQEKLAVNEINELLDRFSTSGARLLKRLPESRYEIYFPRLARVIADWVKHERRIQRLNDEGQAALCEFEYSQFSALDRVYGALKEHQKELETRDVEEQKAFPYPSAMMISQALVRILLEIRERKNYYHEEAPIFGVSFFGNLLSSDGLWLATCSLDGTLAIWDLLDGGAPIVVHDGVFWDVAFAPDGTKLATVSWKKSVIIWDFTRKQLTKAFDLDHDAPVYSVAFSQNGQRLATGSSSGTVCLWSLDEKKTSKFFPTGRGPVSHISFRPDGLALATTSGNYKACVWDLEGQPKPEFAFEENVCCLAFSSDGCLATGSVDGFIRLRNEHGKEIQEVNAHAGVRICHISFDANGQQLATVSWDGTAKLWNLQKSEGTLSVVQPPEIIRLSKHFTYRVAITADRKLMATASSDGAAHLWELDRQLSKFAKCQFIQFKVDKAQFFDTSFSPDGQVLAAASSTASSDNIARLWSLEANKEGNELPSLKGHLGRVFRVNFSGNGEYLVTASADKTAHLWKRGESVKEFSYSMSVSHSMSVYCACFSPDDDRVATASEDGDVCIWDLQGKNIRRFPHPGPVYYAWFSPHGEWLATASLDGLVRLWNPQEPSSQEPLKPLRGTRSSKCPVFCVSFRHDGKQLASVSGDGYLQLWDLPDDGRGGLACKLSFEFTPVSLLVLSTLPIVVGWPPRRPMALCGCGVPRESNSPSSKSIRGRYTTSPSAATVKNLQPPHLTAPLSFDKSFSTRVPLRGCLGTANAAGPGRLGRLLFPGLPRLSEKRKRPANRIFNTSRGLVRMGWFRGHHT